MLVKSWRCLITQNKKKNSPIVQKDLRNLMGIFQCKKPKNRTLIYQYFFETQVTVFERYQRYRGRTWTRTKDLYLIRIAL